MCSRAALTVAVIPLAALAFVLVEAWKQYSHFGYMVFGLSSQYFNARTVGAQGGWGWPAPTHGTHIGSEYADLWQAFLFSLWGLFGRVYIPAFLRTADYDLLAPGGPEERFCRSVLDYMWGSPVQSGFSYPSIYADRQDVLNWISACRAEYARMGEEERGLLLPISREGAVPYDTLVPESHDEQRQQQVKEAGREAGAAPYSAEKISRQELEDMLRVSIAVMNESEEWLLQQVEYYEQFDLRRPNRVAADWKEIAGAMKNGEIAMFDATKLLPPEVFNITVSQLADGEGGEEDRIVIWQSSQKPQSLRQLATTLEGVQHGIAAQTSISGFSNTKRLPKFSGKLPNIAAAMGLEDDVLRSESFLWLGNVHMPIHYVGTQGLHYDEEPNFYVHLSGEMNLVVIHPNFTDVAFGGSRHPSMPRFDEPDPYLARVPLHLVRMRPGDGITFPGRAYHWASAVKYDRVALNCFFIPRWRRMEYLESDWYSREARASPVRLALRQLWARTLARLYDETGRAIIFMGTKLEYN